MATGFVTHAFEGAGVASARASGMDTQASDSALSNKL